MQKKDVINLVVRRLLLNYIARPQFPSTTASYAIFADGNQPGVLQRVGSAAGNIIVIFTYLHTYRYVDKWIQFTRVF